MYRFLCFLFVVLPLALRSQVSGIVLDETGQPLPYASVYARGTESLTDSYRLLDTTPYGRQEDWEDSPAGWPQRPTYG